MSSTISAFTAKMGGASEERTPTLSELCGDAAKHVAQARIALFSEAVDTDGALDHLDQAIFLLQRLSAHGRAMGLDPAPARLSPRLRDRCGDVARPQPCAMEPDRAAPARF